MNSKITAECIKLLQEALKLLENPKGSILAAIQKISRVSKILENKHITAWCEVQFGNIDYTNPLINYGKALIQKIKNKTKKTKQNFQKKALELKKLNLMEKDIYFLDELSSKLEESSGGINNIGFIEEKYADLVRTKKGNDGTFYKSNVNKHLNIIRNLAHKKASELYNSLAYADTPKTSFDFLKSAIDDKLLDLNPELAEQLMLAFRSVSSNNPEEWSQALTTCRRLIEKLADELYPSTKKKIAGRSLGKSQYINRLWAFMDEAISSESNKKLAKVHVDLLGQYIDKTHNLSNKGVHSNLTQIEAIKSVFHLYLFIADILNYIDDGDKINDKTKISINDATLDELESILNISRNICKEIVKFRAINGKITIDDLKNIKGIGKKTIDKIIDLLVVE